MSRQFFVGCYIGAHLLGLWGTTTAATTGDESQSTPSEAQIFVDPNSAGIDYQLQGEYRGRFASGNPWGAHLIAIGDGSFQAIGYRGGLPGDGWNGASGEYLAGKIDGEVVSMATDAFLVRVDRTGLKLLRSDNSLLGELTRVDRISPTMGVAPPENAIVLFDGSSLDAWHDAEMAEGSLLAATNCYTKRTFGDHQVHLEFRIPFMPRESGLRRGNSGLYIQRRYEVQILDSFGRASDEHQCGAIYGIAKPLVNISYPPLAWQTFDVDFVSARFDEVGTKITNARITVRHNGVLVHDNLEIPRQTPGEHAEMVGGGPLLLQGRNCPVVYRNIWVLER